MSADFDYVRGESAGGRFTAKDVCISAFTRKGEHRSKTLTAPTGKYTPR